GEEIGLPLCEVAKFLIHLGHVTPAMERKVFRPSHHERAHYGVGNGFVEYRAADGRMPLSARLTTLHGAAPIGCDCLPPRLRASGTEGSVAGSALAQAAHEG